MKSLNQKTIKSHKFVHFLTKGPLEIIMRKLFPDYILITLKGIAMGAADVVPGVSGGTIAFISGIYEELLSTINSINLDALKTLKNQGIKSAWNAINGNFLLALLVGIATSILSLSKIIIHLLKTEPILVWSFFFGLVVASIVHIWKQVYKWGGLSVAMLILGIAISYYITIARPVSSPDSALYLFFSGFLAIIAMILPGVSGAFILLLMGSYEAVLGNINLLRDSLVNSDADGLRTALGNIGLIALGCILGIKLFSKILKWMFENHKNATLTLLIGFMIGSLNKLWPWKEVLETRINSHGETVPFLERSILPINFDGEPQIIGAIIASVLGFLTIYLLEKFAQKKA